MKKVFFAALSFAILWAGECMAQTVTLPLVEGQLNVSGLISNLRPGYGFDNHRHNLGLLYIPALSFHTASGAQVADIDVGFTFAQSGQTPVTAGQSGGIYTAVGVRVDTLAQQWGATSWFRQHVTSAPIPAVELGPLGGYLKTDGGWIYGVYCSAKLF